MAHFVNDDCINCGACEAECPTEAIFEGDGKREVEPDKCIDCSACEAVCPTEAIQLMS